MITHLVNIFQDLVRLQSVTAVSISLTTSRYAYLSVCDNSSLAVRHNSSLAFRHLGSQINIAACLPSTTLHLFSGGLFNINLLCCPLLLVPNLIFLSPTSLFSQISAPCCPLRRILYFIQNLILSVKNMYPLPLMLCSHYCKKIFHLCERGKRELHC